MLQDLFRRSCSDCGAPVEWLDAQAVRKDPELTQLVREAAAWAGERIDSVWRCSRSSCGAVGCCGSMHVF